LSDAITSERMSTRFARFAPSARAFARRHTRTFRDALVIVGILALVLERPWETARPDAQAWFSVIWLGILGSGTAYLAYFRLLSKWGATRTALVAYLLPIVGIVLGALVLQEPIGPALIVGTALVTAGVALVNGRWGRRRLFAEVPPVEPV